MPSAIWGGHGALLHAAPIHVVPSGPTKLIGASGIVGPHGAYGPSGSVNGHGAVGPSGEHNAIGHDYGYAHGYGYGHDDGQWHGEGILESQDYSGHAIAAPTIVVPSHGIHGGHATSWVGGHSISLVGHGHGVHGLYGGHGIHGVYGGHW